MLDTLWTILFCIFVLTGSLPYFAGTYNWSIKAKIFIIVLQLCICSVLIVLGFCSNQGIITNLANIVAILFLIKVLKLQLNNLEKKSAERALQAQEKRSHNNEIIDAESFTVVN